MAARVAVWGIEFYRRRLSHLKRYKCAYGAATGKGTCSGVGLKAFRRAGWIKGWGLLMRQFDRCAICAQELSKRAALSSAAEGGGEGAGPGLSAASGLGAGALRAGQGGFIDCSGCDAPGCDAPSCDLPSCELPSCELPSCHLPELPSCRVPDLPACEFPSLSFPSCSSAESSAAGAGSRVCSSGAWDFLYCFDCGSCSGTTGSGKSRAEMAKEREERRRLDREQRREDGKEEKKEEAGEE